MTQPKLMGLSGSLRSASFNTKLMHAAMQSFGDADRRIGDLSLPLYNGDVEAEGIPAPVTELAQGITWADAIVIANPEYNKGISGVLKNALDWISRVPGNILSGKPVLLIGAAAGRTGGETSYYMARNCLAPLGAEVLATPALLIAGVHNEFAEDGTLKSDRYQTGLDAAAQALRAAALRT